RFAFEKFPEADSTLGSQMKSVGEAMAIGRTFKEALQKALRSMEDGRGGLGLDRKDRLSRGEKPTRDEIREMLTRPTAERIFWLRYALRCGMTAAQVHEFSSVDPWFLAQIEELSETEDLLRAAGRLEDVSDALLRRAKRQGFSDAQLAFLYGKNVLEVHAERK